MECKFQEIHFAHLSSQSNIYGFSWFFTKEDNVSAKLLVASLKKPIVCFEYNNKPFEDLVPSFKEIHFTYIPGGTEIISIDNFNRSKDLGDLTIGITFTKIREDEAPTYYLNIYKEWEPDHLTSLETISQSCISLELNFVPYKLYHTEITYLGEKEMVWLLSGHDEKIHLFKQGKGHSYNEQFIGDYFLEMNQLPSIVINMDMVTLEESGIRMTALGCEDGTVMATAVDTLANDILKSVSIRHDSMISCIKLFKLKSEVKPPSFISNTLEENEADDYKNYHLLVISTLETAVVYWKIFSGGALNRKLFPGSDCHDVIQCACVADVDMDGLNEIVIGTYGQQLIVYKCVEMIGFHGMASLTKSKNDTSPSVLNKEQFTNVWQRKFSYPLLAVNYVDVTGDGMKELVVLSTKGIHILQHNLADACKLFVDRLKRIANNSQDSKPI